MAWKNQCSKWVQEPNFILESSLKTICSTFWSHFLKVFSKFCLFISDFIKYKSECDPDSSTVRLSGLLNLHLLSGRGLRAGGRSRRIRDLYCVVEIDHIHKARYFFQTSIISNIFCVQKWSTDWFLPTCHDKPWNRKSFMNLF